jgi:hypothetical protein
VYVVCVPTKHCAQLQTNRVVPYSQNQRCQQHGMPRAARPEATPRAWVSQLPWDTHRSSSTWTPWNYLFPINETSPSNDLTASIRFIVHRITPSTSTRPALVDTQLHGTSVDHRSSRRSSRDTKHEHLQCAQLVRRRRNRRRLRWRRSGSSGGTSGIIHRPGQNRST